MESALRPRNASTWCADVKRRDIGDRRHHRTRRERTDARRPRQQSHDRIALMKAVIRNHLVTMASRQCVTSTEFLCGAP